MLCSGGQALPGEHIEGTRTTTEERSERRLPPHDGTVRSMRRPPAPRAEGDEEPCEEPCARAGRPATECVGLCALLRIKVQVSAHGARPGRLHCGPVGTCTTTSNIAPGIMVHQNKMGKWQDLGLGYTQLSSWSSAACSVTVRTERCAQRAAVAHARGSMLTGSRPLASSATRS